MTRPAPGAPLTDLERELISLCDDPVRRGVVLGAANGDDRKVIAEAVSKSAGHVRNTELAICRALGWKPRRLCAVASRLKTLGLL